MNFGQLSSIHSPTEIRHCRIIHLDALSAHDHRTETFQRYAAEVWRDSEREAFITWLADNPLAGDVIPGTGGLRKVRWRRFGFGKRAGARVIYYNVLEDGCIWLLIVYTKAKFDNLPAAFLNRLHAEVTNEVERG